MRSVQQNPAGSDGKEEEQLSTRRASLWQERCAKCRGGLEDQPWAHYDLPSSQSSAYSLSTLCFIMDMEQLLARPLWRAPYAKGSAHGTCKPL